MYKDIVYVFRKGPVVKPGLLFCFCGMFLLYFLLNIGNSWGIMAQ